MTKDPAFLFYSKDFYEGTRMMLPEERACYIDLLIYQHQHDGIIPNDLRRLTMYCSGCSAEVVERVLNHKFEQTADGWFNHKLDHLVNERSTGKPKKIASACFAGLISSRNLTKSQTIKIKKSFQILDFIEENGKLISDESIIKSRVREWFTKMVDQMVDNLAIANANASKEKGKGGVGEKPVSDDREKYYSLTELKAEVKNQFSWRESMCRNYREMDKSFTPKTLETYLEEFFKLISGDGDTERTLKDFQKHFNRWALKEIQKGLKRPGQELKGMDKDVMKKLEKYG